jgi:glycerophosphoryl diester phosphodiesterase
MGPLEYILNLTIGTFYALYPQQRPNKQQISNAKLVAHRGVHEKNLAKENSLEAFDLAVKNNIWAAELDIHFTSDNVPVVNHDPDGARLFGRPDIVIAAISFEKLRAEIPEILSLEEVIKKFSPQLHLMIELKVDLRIQPQHKDSLKKVLQNIRPVTDYHLLSLNPDFLIPIDFASKEALLDVIWLNAKGIIQKNYDLGHGAIAGHFLFFSNADIKRLHTQGKKVGVGFLDSKNSLYRELCRGADFIFTNHPISLNKHLKDLT